MAKEYWWCRIGPIERKKVPFGGDFPMRQAAQAAFRQTTGEWPKWCSSGWGMSEEEARATSEVQNHFFRKRHGLKAEASKNAGNYLEALSTALQSTGAAKSVGNS